MAAPEQHALLSASSSHRWLNCPPSVRLAENFPGSAEGLRTYLASFVVVIDDGVLYGSIHRLVRYRLTVLLQCGCALAAHVQIFADHKTLVTDQPLTYGAVVICSEAVRMAA